VQIGFGDIVPQNGWERVFCIFAMVFGSWCYAYCITQVVEQVANMQAAEVRFKEHQDNLLEYMNARNLPMALQQRMLAFYEFQKRHAAVFHRCVLS
jgi:Na+/melibiose symporter-like transporter